MNKQILNNTVKRFKKATENHPDKDTIREKILHALNQGADPLQLYQTGVTMCHSHSGKIILQGDEGNVTVVWGWFDEN